MARMIHDDKTPTHAAELAKNIFNILQSAPQTRDWVVFYRKNVHPTRPIDFIILIPDYCSVICLDMEDGLEEAMCALKDQYHYFREGTLLSLGSLRITDADGQDSDELVKKLNDHANRTLTEEVRNQLLNNWALELAQTDLNELRNELEGIGPERPETIFSANLETLRPQLLRLTADQIKILDNLKEKTRYAIDGAAGTGKTVLAKELAKRRCEAGDTVALLCSNPNLIRHLEPWAKKLSDGNKGEIVAGTPATLPSWAFRNDYTSLVRHQRRLDDSPELEKSLKFGYLEAKWSLFVDETVNDLGQGSIFDYLIVDEAQNLCDEVFLKLMHALLKNGLTGGRFTMFGDFTNQDIVFYPSIENGRNALENFIKDKSSDLPDISIKLETNCRNTYQIARKTAALTALGAPPLSGAHGPDVQIEFSSGEEWKERLDHLVRDLKARDFHSRQIILLASDDDRFNMDSCGGWELSNIREAFLNSTPSNDILRCSDIYDFQGLESDVAILVIPLTDDHVTIGGGAILPREEHLRKMLYTGMSRAKAMLIIVADESYEEFFN